MHSTKDCQALRDKIKELIQAGHLVHFVKRNDKWMSERESWDDDRTLQTTGYSKSREENLRKRVVDKAKGWEPHEKPLRGVIITIFEGFVRGGTTTSTRNKYLRVVQSVNGISTYPRRRTPLITFWDEDF